MSSFRTKADGSIALSLSTPELQPDEVAAFAGLRNKNLKLVLQPVDGEPVELKEVKGEFDSKTPSQRMRSVLFILWKELGSDETFDEFYRKRMEIMIGKIKEKFPEKD